MMEIKNRSTILLVEDEVLVSMNEKASLEKCGYDVLAVNTSAKAIEILREVPDIDLILMDVDLGDDIDGTDLAEKILMTYSIPVLFLSSYSEPEIVEKADRITPYGYVVKDAPISIMDSSIKMALRLYKAKRDVAERDNQIDLLRKSLKSYEEKEAFPAGSVSGDNSDIPDVTEIRFSDVLNSLEDAFALHEIILNEKGSPVDYRFLFVNRAFGKLTGLQPDTIIGKRVLDVLPDTEEYWIKNYGRVAQTGVSIQYENYSQDLDRYFHVSAFSPEKGRFATLFWDITDRKKYEMEIKDALSEKEILLKEVHHRIKNNIASIENLLTLHLDSNISNDTVSALHEAVSRVKSMRILYEKLLDHESYKSIKAETYVNSLVESVAALYSTGKDIEIKTDIEDISLSSSSLFPIGIVLNELLTNSLKYAFEEMEKGSIDISLKRAGGRIMLTVRDDGKGLSPEFDLSEQKSFGLMIVKLLSGQLGGRFEIRRSHGTECILTFKKP